MWLVNPWLSCEFSRQNGQAVVTNVAGVDIAAWPQTREIKSSKVQSCSNKIKLRKISMEEYMEEL